MKITYLLTQSLESPSGLGRYWPLAKELVKRNHQVEIYALHPDIKSLNQRKIKKSGVSINYVAPMHVKKIGNVKKYYSFPGLIWVVLQATWKLSIQAIRSDSDILHIAKPHPMNSIAGLSAKYIKNKQVFLDCDDFEAASGNFTSNWQASSVAYFEKNIPKHVTLTTTNTQFMQDKLLSWGISEEKIYYLPNGVDRTRFESSEKQDLMFIREELGLNSKRIVSYIGSMSLANHAVDLLLNAFSGILDSLPDTVLLLVGSGEDFNKLQLMASSLGLENYVHFTGYIPPDQVPNYYRVSDVCIDPVYDNDAARGRSPLKLFESWASGIPFVTSDVGDRRYILGDPPAGELASPGDPLSLSKAIIKVLSDRELQVDLKQRGKNRVQNFYWDQLVIGIEKIYQGKLNPT